MKRKRLCKTLFGLLLMFIYIIAVVLLVIYCSGLYQFISSCVVGALVPHFINKLVNYLFEEKESECSNYKKEYED